jgi:hypothetical protein
MHVRSILKRPFQLPRPPRARRAKKKKRWSLASRFPTRAAWPRPNTEPSRSKQPRQEGSRRGRPRRKRPRATPASPPGHYHTLGLGVVQTPRWQKRSDDAVAVAPARRAAGVGDTVSRPPPVAKCLTSPHPRQGPSPHPPRRQRQRQWTSPPDHSLSLKRSLRTRRAPPPRLRLPLSPPPPTAFKYLPRTRHGLTLPPPPLAIHSGAQTHRESQPEEGGVLESVQGAQHTSNVRGKGETKR